MTGWWFQIFFIFAPIWGRFPFWLIFFRWVETTNQMRIIPGLHPFGRHEIRTYQVLTNHDNRPRKMSSLSWRVTFSVFCHTVDGWNPANQLRLVVYPIIYTLCRRDRFKNSACTDKPINPPIGPFPDSARLSVYRFIGAGHPDQPINR